MIRLTFALTAIWLFGLAQSTHAADTIANNLANTRNGGQSVNVNSWAAQAFTTSLTAYVLDSVTVNMSRDLNVTAGSIELIIYDSSGTAGRPGSTASSVFATIDAVSQLSGTVADITFNGLNVVLNPTTTYYLVLRGVGITGGGDALWSYTNTTTGTGFPSNYSETNDGGTSWDAPVQSSPQKMAITAVPEPSTYVLAGLSAITAMLAARRRRRRMG